jgi:hypothetical protein
MLDTIERHLVDTPVDHHDYTRFTSISLLVTYIIQRAARARVRSNPGNYGMLRSKDILELTPTPLIDERNERKRRHDALERESILTSSAPSSLSMIEAILPPSKGLAKQNHVRHVDGAFTACTFSERWPRCWRAAAEDSPFCWEHRMMIVRLSQTQSVKDPSRGTDFDTNQANISNSKAQLSCTIRLDARSLDFLHHEITDLGDIWRQSQRSHIWKLVEFDVEAEYEGAVLLEWLTDRLSWYELF